MSLRIKIVEKDVSAEADEQARIAAIYALAHEQHHEEGKCEIDEDGEEGISEGDDNGAYVRCWVWVDFGGTDLDKQCPECDELDCDTHNDEDADEDEDEHEQRGEDNLDKLYDSLEKAGVIGPKVSADG